MIGSRPRRRCSSSGMQPASDGVPGPGDSISTGWVMLQAFDDHLGGDLVTVNHHLVTLARS